MSKNWFVGIVRPNMDWRAADDLRGKGARVFLPKRITRVEIGRHQEARIDLRFAGYIFIQCSADESGFVAFADGIDGTAHPTGLVCEGGNRPLALPPGAVEMYQRIADEEMARALARKRPEPRRDLHLGETVRFIGSTLHPAYGLTGEFHGSPKRGRATIMVNFRPWEVSEADLERIETPKVRAV